MTTLSSCPSFTATRFRDTSSSPSPRLKGRRSHEQRCPVPKASNSCTSTSSLTRGRTLTNSLTVQTRATSQASSTTLLRSVTQSTNSSSKRFPVAHGEAVRSTSLRMKVTETQLNQQAQAPRALVSDLVSSKTTSQSPTPPSKAIRARRGLSIKMTHSGTPPSSSLTPTHR